MALLQTYALTAIVLELKMATIALVQGRGRVSTGTFVLPEDAKLFHGTAATEEPPIVERASRAWRNDLENIPIFLILGGIYCAADLSAKAFALYCLVFTVTSWSKSSSDLMVRGASLSRRIRREARSSCA
jgi:hypothetical protein